ncbi:MAG TPA: proton-conducting transporter membrane subunit [Sandaracinaceae bacterium LLY-WYZ-13_1]|nr:proton-conducting transporter membrane subunit [Sandaracinaceae bacterium LLY-WYZ-13_1]
MPDTLFPLLALLAPLAFLAAAATAPFASTSRARGVRRCTTVASVVALLAAATAAVGFALHGSLVSPAIPLVRIGLDTLAPSVRVDGLSAVMLAMIALLAAVLVRYSHRYLDGDAGQPRFLGWLSATVGSVMLIVLAGDLLVLVAAWIATSFALHRLLLFYPQRRAAVIAARKKFLVARAGDALLAMAAVLLTHAFGTTDLGTIFEGARRMVEAGDAPLGVGLAAMAVVLAAMLKSAQFPTHGWLVEVMETPTPVSALLHAGILNGGPFLVVRLSDVVVTTPAAMHALVGVGGLTALFASVVMTTQSRVKVALGYSSAAHMGFMLLVCGLGAWPAAILHLVAHSFYKAHAFLSSGSAVEVARASFVPTDGRPPHPARVAAGVALASALYAGVAALFGLSPWRDPGALALGAILVVGLTTLVARGLDDAPHVEVIGRTLGAALATTVAFFVLEGGTAAILDGSVAPVPIASPTTLALGGAVIGAFALATVALLYVPRLGRSRLWDAAYVHLRNGLYANALFDRVVGAHRR